MLSKTHFLYLVVVCISNSNFCLSFCNRYFVILFFAIVCFIMTWSLLCFCLFWKEETQMSHVKVCFINSCQNTIGDLASKAVERVDICRLRTKVGRKSWVFMIMMEPDFISYWYLISSNEFFLQTCDVSFFEKPRI